MGKVVILTEKPSASRHFAEALGGMSGTYNGESYQIVAARGHLYEFKDPKEMVPADKVESYSSWELSELPWDEKDFSWDRESRGDARSAVSDIKKAFMSASEIVIASDIDPTGEGDLLAWEIVDELGFADGSVKYSRMEFTDETVSSLQKAFTNRRTITSMWDEGDFRKAYFRSKFDLLSMQWTRVATKVLGMTGRRAVLRNGRLKSSMVVIVGDGLKAYNSYVKKPVYMPRFKDDNGIVYEDKSLEGIADKSAVDLSHLHESSVTADGSSDKSVAPPKLLDLAGLSAMLGKQGVKAKDLLAIYQKMYESQIVSYPRTEDRHVTTEQFKEMLPNIDKIASLVGVNPEKLSHRSPRKSHVKDKGAHGANRPGPVVPSSMDSLEKTYGKTGRLIYETLAKNYLTMLAEDYVYTQHKGHVTDFATFTGIANVPKSQGWKDIFTVDAELVDEEDEMSGVGLGSTATPFVGEKVNARPPHPSQGWLMKQLEKYSVGTGATRVSTFNEVTSGKSALIKESKGSKLTLSETGEMNYMLLPGTKIGDIKLTEKIYEDMGAIAKGTLTEEEALAPVKDWVREDIATMMANSTANITEDMGKKLMTGFVQSEKASGEWVGAPGEQTKFKREYRGHRFTDDEVAKLLVGETITVEASGSNGETFLAEGKLEAGSFTNDSGKTINFVGFKSKAGIDPKVHAVGEWVGKPGAEIKFKRSWGGIDFTDMQCAQLLEGKTIEVTGSKGTVMGKLAENTFESKGKTITYYGFTPQADPAKYAIGQWSQAPGVETKFKREWCGRKFTDQEIVDLLAGKEISFEMDSEKIKGTIVGWLEKKEYNGNAYVGFTGVNTDTHFVGEWVKAKGKKTKFKKQWGSHTFTDAEAKDLLAGKKISFKATSKAGKPYEAKGQLETGEYNGNKYVGFSLEPRK